MIVSFSPIASAATPSPTPALATVGSAPIVPFGAHAQGATPLNQTVSFDVVLKPRNQAALDSFVQAVSTPNSPQYRQFLAPGEFASTFGPTPQAIAAVESQMKSLGLKVNSVTGSVVSVSGTTAQVGSALHTSFAEYKLASGRVARVNIAAPELPAAITSVVQSMVGLDQLVQLEHPRPNLRALSNALAPRVAGPQACFSTGAGYYTAGQLAHYYGMDSFYGSNVLGSGVTVALLELEPFSNSDISIYQTCYGTSASVAVSSVDGGAGVGAGSGEAALDIEDIVGLAPDANIAVYEAPNSGTGVIADLNAIAADDDAVVSTSWGDCEASVGAAFAQSERSILQQMAAQGQSVFAAAGDSGSEDCEQHGSTDLAVDDPASQPEVTGVGGTDLTSPAGPENPWNERASANGAGGGGISSVWQMPSWQSAVGEITSPDGTKCSAGAGAYCREVPDVSASADPFDGYPIYYSDPDFGADWYVFGGTSAAAPTWASLVALIDSSCSTHRLGLINPSLYQLEAATPADFNDVATGNNDYTGTNHGSYAAGARYDMATGLGTPAGGSIGAALCPASVPDGGGTMSVNPSTVPVSGHKSMTFTYTAPNGQALTDGTLTLSVPADWSAPSINASDAGYTTSSDGVVSVSGATIKVDGVTTIGGGTVSITYGDKSGGGPGALTPAILEAETFTAKSTSGATLTALTSGSPKVFVGAAADGAGTMTVSPTSTLASSTNNTLGFTYTPPTGTGLIGGEVDVTIPAGWTTPQITTPTTAGFVPGPSAGTVSVSGSTIKVKNLTLAIGATLSITYGDKSGPAPGATAPDNGGSNAFVTKQAATSNGVLTALTGPTVQVVTGSVSASPSSVTPGAKATLTFTYTPAVGAPLVNGEVAVTVPAGWTAPQDADPAAAGFVSSPDGTIGITANTITLTNVSVTAPASVKIIYGDVTGSPDGAAVAPSASETSTFATSQQVAGSGNVHSVASNPTVTVGSSGGGGGGGGAAGHPALQRIFGSDRIATSIAASQAAFPKASSAQVVVLANSSSFADALAGTPLAAEKKGPLLLTSSTQLPDPTVGEIDRVLPTGGTIYLLGGTVSIGAGVANELKGFGYDVQRLAGSDRYATAVAIAGALGNPTTVFEADGTLFPDGLSAGAAAAQQHAAVLLTAGATMPTATSAYLSAHPSVRYAVGGPAAKADPGAKSFVGADRYATSILVAQAFFSTPTAVGLASGMAFPDALSGGVVAALNGGPIVLVPSTGSIPATTLAYLANTASNSASSAWLFGGTASIGASVFSQAAAALAPPTT